MAYDADLAFRVRQAFAEWEEVRERRMFGTLVFLLRGRMCCAVSEDRLIARLGIERYADALDEPFVRPMDFTGVPLRGWVYVDGPGLDSDSSLRRWVSLAAQFVESMPERTQRSRRRSRSSH